MQAVVSTVGAGAPERSLSQRMDALERANRVRTRRAQLKRDVKARRVSAVDVLLSPPEWVETMRVVDLMLAMPKVGRSKANAILQRQRVSASKTVAGLTERQRKELVVALAPYVRLVGTLRA